MVPTVACAYRFPQVPIPLLNKLQPRQLAGSTCGLVRHFSVFEPVLAAQYYIAFFCLYHLFDRPPQPPSTSLLAFCRACQSTLFHSFAFPSRALAQLHAVGSTRQDF